MGRACGDADRNSGVDAGGGGAHCCDGSGIDRGWVADDGASHGNRLKSDPAIAIPAFLTLITNPLTFSIANGLAFGFTSYAVLRAVRGKFRETHWLVYLLAALFIVRFIYLRSN